MNDFSRALIEKTGCAVIVAGSDSDAPHVERIVSSLKEYGIPYEQRICSAHKEPDRLLKLVREYEEAGGALVFVAVAGGTDALSGTLAFHARSPVISCPPDGADLSCLRNPPGSSNAAILLPRNVGRFIAQIFAAYNPELRKLLAKSREEKVRKLAEKDRGLQI